jgi:hypothetical protein
MATDVRVERQVLSLHHISRNLSFIVGIQLPNAKLLHRPFFEVFVGAVPPGTVGIGKRVPDIWRTLDTTKTMRVLFIGRKAFTH